MKKDQENKATEERVSSRFTITDAPAPRSAGISRRRKQYLMSQLFRLICIAFIVVVDNWLFRSLLGAIAIFLPWIAVLRANDDRETTDVILCRLSDTPPTGAIAGESSTAVCFEPSSAASPDTIVLKTIDTPGEVPTMPQEFSHESVKTIVEEIINHD